MPKTRKGVTATADFGRARRRRLADQSSEHTTPEEALELARDFLVEGECSGLAVVVLERKNGGVVILSAGATLGGCTYLLEAAKLTLMLEGGGAE